MKTMQILSQVAEIESSPESIPLILRALAITHDELMNIDVSSMDSELDYALEHALETALELANSGDLSGKDLANAARFVSENWLTLEEIPGGTPREINVRAAEFLSAVSPKTGTIPYPEDNPFTIESVRELISSEDWKARYLGALIAKEHFPHESAELLESLSEDPFEDEDGIFLVREAAGFSDDDV